MVPDVIKHNSPFDEISKDPPSQQDIARMMAPWKRQQQVNLLQKMQTGDQPYTEVTCKGPSYNVTCAWKNLYFQDGQLHAYFSKETSIPDEMNSVMSIHRFGWPEPPIVVRGSPPAVDSIVPGLTLYYSTIWHQNIAHFLWDGLYPAYVALSQWGRENANFNSLVGYAEDCLQKGTADGKCVSEEIMKTFGGKDTLFLVKNGLQGTHRFEELIMGSGHKGARTINRDVTMWGRDLDALRAFRDRLFKTHGLTPPPRRSRSMDDRKSDVLQAIIIDNKRFSEAELQELHKPTRADWHRELSKARHHWPGYEKTLQVNYVDLGQTGNNFTEQLLLLQKNDIYVSGPGTGNGYLDLMPDGSVGISTGMVGVWNYPIDFKRPYPDRDVSFMEEYWAEGHSHLKAFHYPVKMRRDGIKANVLIGLIHEAADLILSNFQMPVEPGENLSPVGKTFKEYCHTVGEELCDKLLATINADSGPGQCQDSWPEAIVWETAGWSEEGIEGVHCEFNRTLLQTIRQKYLGV